MAGKKTKSSIKGASAYLDYEVRKKGEVIHALYGISYKTKFEYGSKIPQELKRKSFRTHIGRAMPKEVAEKFKEFLIELGEKDVKLEKLKMSLPSKCPSCGNKGSPTMYQGKGTVRVGDAHNKRNREEIRLIYNHSKTKPKTCVIGTVNLKTRLPEIALKSKLKINSLHIR